MLKNLANREERQYPRKKILSVYAWLNGVRIKMLTDENRRYILTQFLRDISHITDKEYQKRVWIRGEGPECDDFEETCCHFFDDRDPLLEQYKDFNITERQYTILKKFRDEFEVFSDENNWPEEFIDTLEWAQIMKMAKEVLEVFNYPKPEITS